jgi:hypothetical protein
MIRIINSENESKITESDLSYVYGGGCIFSCGCTTSCGLNNSMFWEESLSTTSGPTGHR